MADVSGGACGGLRADDAVMNTASKASPSLLRKALNRRAHMMSQKRSRESFLGDRNSHFHQHDYLLLTLELWSIRMSDGAVWALDVR